MFVFFLLPSLVEGIHLWAPDSELISPDHLQVDGWAPDSELSPDHLQEGAEPAAWAPDSELSPVGPRFVSSTHGEESAEPAASLLSRSSEALSMPWGKVGLFFSSTWDHGAHEDAPVRRRIRQSVLVATQHSLHTHCAVHRHSCGGQKECV